MSTVAEALVEARYHIDAAFNALAACVEAMAEVEDLKMVSIKETAGLLDVSESTIYAMCRDGRLRSVDGKIPRKVIREYIDGKRVARRSREGR